MTCKCKICGQPVEDCLTLCIKCFLETSDDKVKKNIVAGGRFYERRTMREKMAEIIAGVDISHILESVEYRELADQILTLITEEIEKVENPWGEESPNFHYFRCHTFEQCRRRILSLLRPQYCVDCNGEAAVKLEDCPAHRNPVGNAEQ